MMLAGWERVRALSPRTILAISFVAFLAYSFPGYMSNDSYVQLMEARTGIRTDLHPALMAIEWKLLDAVISGPVLMLVLQGLLALWGLYAILRRVMSLRAASVVAGALLVFPPILTTFAVIWKDSQMAAFLLAGIACMLDDRRWMRVLGLVAMSVACAFRLNAPAAAMPLVGLLFVWRPGLVWWRRYLISSVAAVLVVAFAFGATRALTVRHVLLTSDAYDIVAVIANGPAYTDEQLREILRDTPLVVTTDIQAKARAIYTPRNPFWYYQGPERMFDPPWTDVQRAALARARWQLIRDHWDIYLLYRWQVFRELVGDTPRGLWAPVWNAFLERLDQAPVISHLASLSPLQAELATWFGWLADETPLFHPSLYLWLALALLVLCARDRTSIALLASGVLYELGYFPFVYTPDYRYSHWLVVCTCCAAVLIGARRYRQVRS
jgi:hypothetical protein